MTFHSESRVLGTFLTKVHFAFPSLKKKISTQIQGFFDEKTSPIERKEELERAIKKKVKNKAFLFYGLIDTSQLYFLKNYFILLKLKRDQDYIDFQNQIY